MSMSTVRKHFCTEVARGHGGTSSPRKNGLKGTMPAMVNSTDGSWGMRLAEGTARVPALGEEPDEGGAQLVGVERRAGSHDVGSYLAR